MTTAPARRDLTDVDLRYGVPHDLDALASLFARCSAASRRRRFHTSLAVVPRRLALGTLAPQGGWSVVAAADGGGLVGIATAGPLSASDLEIGLLVEDAHQRRGIGSRLLLAVAGDAARRGYRTLTCLTQHDNAAVPRMAARTGLPTAVRAGDGLAAVTMQLPAPAP